MVEKENGDEVCVWLLMYFNLVGENDDLNVVDVGERNVVEELNGYPVECSEACWDKIGELDNVSKLKWMM